MTFIHFYAHIMFPNTFDEIVHTALKSVTMINSCGQNHAISLNITRVMVPKQSLFKLRRGKAAGDITERIERALTGGLRVWVSGADLCKGDLSKPSAGFRPDQRILKKSSSWALVEEDPRIERSHNLSLYKYIY